MPAPSKIWIVGTWSTEAGGGGEGGGGDGGGGKGGGGDGGGGGHLVDGEQLEQLAPRGVLLHLVARYLLAVPARDAAVLGGDAQAGAAPLRVELDHEHLVLLHRAAARREEVVDGGEVGDEVRVAAVRTATAAAHVVHHLIRTGLTAKIRAEVRV